MAGSANPPKGSEKAQSEARRDRLADALRANLRRRKDQKRGRDAAQDAETTTDAAPGDNDGLYIK